MYFVDTNIWFYRFSNEDEKKYSIAYKLTENKDIITSLQVVNEISANLIRKLNFSQERTKGIIKQFCKLKWRPIRKSTILKACDLRIRYQFGYWDSLLLATALEAQCDIFFSEDLQNGMKIDNMTIINPFAVKEECKDIVGDLISL